MFIPVTEWVNGFVNRFSSKISYPFLCWPGYRYISILYTSGYWEWVLGGGLNCVGERRHYKAGGDPWHKRGKRIERISQ